MIATKVIDDNKIRMIDAAAYMQQTLAGYPSRNRRRIQQLIDEILALYGVSLEELQLVCGDAYTVTAESECRLLEAQIKRDKDEVRRIKRGAANGTR